MIINHNNRNNPSISPLNTRSYTATRLSSSIMTIHSLHIFDRKGKTLFTKTYSPVAIKQQRVLEESFKTEEAHGNDENATAAAATTTTSPPTSDALDEQRKLIFGMLFSLRELMGTLTPTSESNIRTSPLECVQTKSTKVHSYETLHGLRFAMYTSTDVQTSASSSRGGRNSASLSSSSNTNDLYGSSNSEEKVYARDVLRHVYAKIWVECVVRSPMYSPSAGISSGNSKNISEDKKAFSVQSTNFEKELNTYLSSLPWFR